MHPDLDRPDPESFSLAWDRFLANDHATSPAFDSADAAIVRRLHELMRSVSPQPTFVTRLEETLMSHASISIPMIPVSPVPLNGRVPATRRRPATRAIPPRAGLFGNLALVALLVAALAGGLIALSPSRGGHQSGIPAVAPGVSPSSTPAMTSLLTATLDPALLPSGNATVEFVQVDFDAGILTTRTAGDFPAGIRIDHVVAGRYTIKSEAPLRVVRGATGSIEEVAPGVNAILAAGDSVIVPRNDAQQVFGNAGTEPATVLMAGILAAELPPPPAGITAGIADVMTSELAGAVTLELFGSELDAGATIPAPAAGTIRLAVGNPAPSGTPLIGQGSDGSVVNIGRERAAIWLLDLKSTHGMAIVAATEPAGPPVPPEQPANGPGGAAYRFAEVRETNMGGGGREAAGYFLFEPLEPGSDPLPVVLFLHERGEGGNPLSYRTWIDHLVRRGAVVIFPSQRSMGGQTSSATVLTNVQEAVRAALDELTKPGHAPVDPNTLTVAGHGLGASTAIDFAVTAEAAGLPRPRAVMAVLPAGTLESDASAIPAATLIAVIDGDGDLIATDPPRRLWRSLGSPADASTRVYLTMRSDAHGEPELDASYYAPMAATFGGSQVTDALDWYGTWKWLDALMACALTGDWCSYVLGNTPEQRWMGAWSDGTPVTEPRVGAGAE